jgi:hypothetical protein
VRGKAALKPTSRREGKIIAQGETLGKRRSLEKNKVRGEAASSLTHPHTVILNNKTWLSS